MKQQCDMFPSLELFTFINADGLSRSILKMMALEKRSRADAPEKRGKVDSTTNSPLEMVYYDDYKVNS